MIQTWNIQSDSNWKSDAELVKPQTKLKIDSSESFNSNWKKNAASKPKLKKTAFPKNGCPIWI